MIAKRRKVAKRPRKAAVPRTNADYRDEAVRRMNEAAIRLIAAHGASKLSLVDVGRESGFSHSLPNYYFESKTQMLAGVFRFIVDRARAAFRADLQRHLPEKTEPGLPRVYAAVCGYLDLVRSDLPATRTINILWSEATCSMPELLEVIRPQNRETISYFAHHLQEGIRLGEVDPSIDVESIAVFIVSALRGLAMQYMADPECADLQKLTDVIVKMLDRSVARRKKH